MKRFVGITGVGISQVQNDSLHESSLSLLSQRPEKEGN